jgi:hypothetical protein
MRPGSSKHAQVYKGIAIYESEGGSNSPTAQSDEESDASMAEPEVIDLCSDPDEEQDSDEEQEVIDLCSDMEEEEDLEEEDVEVPVEVPVPPIDYDWSFFPQVQPREDWPEWAGVELSKGEIYFNRDMLYTPTLGETLYNEWLKSFKATIFDFDTK